MNSTAPNFHYDSLKPDFILTQCNTLNPDDDAFLHHPVIERFGSPEQPIFVDQSSVKQPLILSIYNGQLELVQYAVILDGERVEVTSDGENRDKGLAKGFAYYGKLQKDKPVIITYNLEAYFKIAQTGYAVALVVLPTLCNANLTQFKPFDFEQIQFVINLLSKAGYRQLYMPVRPEHIQLEPLFKALEQNTAVRLLNQFQADFGCDLSHYEEAEDVQAFFDEAIERLNPNKWGELLPLVQASTITATTYPIHAIPTLARQAIQAISEHVQAPIAMTAQCVIGAISHIAQAYVNAPDPFKEQGEPCGLFLLTEGQSGSRKTTSRNLADRAIIKYEHKQYEQYRRELDQWKSMLAGLDKKDKSTFLVDTPPPHDPITRYSDITLESLAGLFVDGIIQNASISSDEAAQFFSGHTMKSDTRNQALGGYAKLFDDGSVERTRSKSNLNGSGRAYDVRLTFNLQGQHEVLSDALKDPVLRGQGFLPRFILTIPENLAGTRLQDACHQANNANLDQRLIAFWNRCEYLLDASPLPLTENQESGGRYVIQMNDEAKQIDLDFYNEIERLQAKGQHYEYLQAFASRASQLARRLATVFAYFEGLNEIDVSTLSSACDVMRHSLGEWARYAEIETVKENDVEKLIKYLQHKCKDGKTNCLHKTVSMKGAPSHLRKVKEFDSCLNELIEFNYVRLMAINRSTYIELNPLLLK